MSEVLRVGELAEVSGVSVRTLHYYDEIGLLRAPRRTDAGYRVYGSAEVLRLQQILIRRALGFSLTEIARALDDPGFDLQQALHQQRAQLLARAEDTQRMIKAIDEALQESTTMRDKVKKLFDGFDPEQYEGEVRERWGDAAWENTHKRVSNYSESDWQEYKNESAAVYRDAAALLDEGADPASEAAMDVAERHRLSIVRWFYDCSHVMHSGLADMYEADARFAETIDKFGEDLTPFLSAAIRANAKRHRD